MVWNLKQQATLSLEGELAHGISNLFLSDALTPNTPKYVFTGIAEFAVHPATLVTGVTYESGIGVREDWRR